MSQNTSPIGRQELANPERGYDGISDAGVALHNAVTSMFTFLSDNMPSRYYPTLALVEGVPFNVVHKLGRNANKLGIRIFIAGTEQPITDYSIGSIDTDTIAITKIPGGGDATVECIVFENVGGLPIAAQTVMGNKEATTQRPVAVNMGDLAAILPLVVVGGAQGLMSGTDKTKLDGLVSKDTGRYTAKTGSGSVGSAANNSSLGMGFTVPAGTFLFIGSITHTGGSTGGHQLLLSGTGVTNLCSGNWGNSVTSTPVIALISGAGGTITFIGTNFGAESWTYTGQLINL